MATLQPAKCGSGRQRLTRRWRARVKVEYLEIYLGTFDTKEEAEAMEQWYRDNETEDAR